MNSLLQGQAVPLLTGREEMQEPHGELSSNSKVRILHFNSVQNRKQKELCCNGGVSSCCEQQALCSFEEPAPPRSPGMSPLKVHCVCFDLGLTAWSLRLLAFVVRISFIVLRAVFSHPKFGERPLL